MRSINVVFGGLVCWTLAACAVTDPSVAGSESEVLGVDNPEPGDPPGGGDGGCTSNAGCPRGTGCYEGTCWGIVQFSPVPAPPLSPPCLTQAHCAPAGRTCSVSYETFTPGGAYGYCFE